MAVANTGDAVAEWDELPIDGSDAWCGLLLLAGSSVVSLRIVGWVIVEVGKILMQ